MKNFHTYTDPAMRTILYLRRNEIDLFDKLPEALRDKWQDKIVEETGEGYETEEELRLRAMRYAKSPALATYLQSANERLQNGSDLASVLQSFPEDAVKVFIDAIGNCGICTLIEVSLIKGGLTDEDIKGLAMLSSIRHRQLMHSTILSN